MRRRRLHLDWETFSECDLKQEGVYRYTAHPSTEVLMLGWAFDDEPVSLWLPEFDAIPDRLQDGLWDPSVDLWAFNAAFERCVCWNVMGWHIPIERWRCTQVLTYYNAFSGRLVDVQRQLGLPDELIKLADGTRLLNKFSKPRKPTKNNPLTRWTWETAPDDWIKFCLYCQQDVVGERAIYYRLQARLLPDQEWEHYFLDQLINDQGLRVDLDLVDNAIMALTQVDQDLNARAEQLTGGIRLTQVGKLKDWLNDQGCQLPDLNATSVEVELTLADTRALPTAAREVLQLRQLAARASNKKWTAFRRTAGDDHRIRGTLQFVGAGRTGRWAGRQIQPTNMVRGVTKDEMTRRVALAKARDFRGVEDIPRFLSSITRGAIVPSPGCQLAVVDLASIETVTIAWHAQCRFLLDAISAGRDVYREFATRKFGGRPEDITGEQRRWAKPAVLQCIYRAGGYGLQNYANSVGVEMTLDEAQDAVDLFRGECWEIVKMWHWLDQVTLYLAADPNCHESFSGYGLTLYRDKDFMTMMLPSGRVLSYYQPAVKNKMMPWTDNDGNPVYQDQMVYMGVDAKLPGTPWQEVTTHGGKLTENGNQASARDVFIYCIRELYKQDHLYLPTMLVHDEGVWEVPRYGAEEHLIKIVRGMSASPPFMPGLVNRAEGFLCDNYQKG